MWVLGFAAMIDNVDQYIVRGTSNQIERVFRVHDFQIGILFSAFIVVNGIATMPASYLGDRWRRTKIMGVTIVCWSLISALGGVVPAGAFALLVALVEWQRPIRIGASLVVIGFGVFRLVNRRHPRALARIPPTQLGLWSFAVAIAHGAGLMLVPIYLGLCRTTGLDGGHEAAGALIDADLGMAVLVSAVHSVAMIAAGGCCAWLVYRYLGLELLSRSWFNLDATWAVSLVLVGAISLALSLDH